MNVNSRRTAPGRDLPLLLFRAGGGDYALPVHAVREVIFHRDAVPVPGAPATLRGLIEHQGRTLPVVQLPAGAAPLLQAPPDPAERRLIVLAAADAPIALEVEAVIELLRVATEALLPPPAWHAGARTGLVAGLVRSGARTVLVLDASRLLDREAHAWLPAAADPAPVQELDSGSG